MRQNITYTCDSGVDGFTLMQLQGINGGLIHYGDKTIRVVSQVYVKSSPFKLYKVLTLTVFFPAW